MQSLFSTDNIHQSDNPFLSHYWNQSIESFEKLKGWVTINLSYAKLTKLIQSLNLTGDSSSSRNESDLIDYQPPLMRDQFG